MRDANWLRQSEFPTAWDEGFTDTSGASGVDPDHTVVPEIAFDSVAYDWSLDFMPNVSDFDNDDDRTLLYLDGGVYVQDVSGKPDGAVPTPYRRFLRIYPICENVTDCGDGICEDNEPECPTSETIGRQVLSSVSWTDRSDRKVLTIEEKLYEWR